MKYLSKKTFSAASLFLSTLSNKPKNSTTFYLTIICSISAYRDAMENSTCPEEQLNEL